MAKSDAKSNKPVRLALISLDKTLCPPIGLAELATYLEKKAGFKNTIIVDKNFDDVAEKITRYNPDIIGISSFTINYSEAIALAKELRAIYPKKLIVLGGPHISTLPKSLHPAFSFGVMGEGEETVREILELYRKKLYKGLTPQSLAAINGLAYFDSDGSIKLTPPRAAIKPLDDIPIPSKKYLNRKYFNKKPMAMMGGKVGVNFSILTSRGCPYRCIFCSTTKFWDCVRMNSAQHIFNEIKELVYKYHVQHIDILDDLFMIDKRRLYALAELMEKEGLNKKVTLFCNLRANLVNEEVLTLLKRLNVKHVGFGFESGSDRILGKLKVNSVTVEQNRKAILLCEKFGFRTSGSLIFGTPTETAADINKTIKFMDFAIEHKVDFLACFVMTPFPDTEIWTIAESKGLVSNDMNWELLSMNALEDIDKTIYINDAMRFKDFKRYYLKAKKKQNYFKRVAIINMIKYDLFNTIIKVIAHPIRSLKVIIRPGVKS